MSIRRRDFINLTGMAAATSMVTGFKAGVVNQPMDPNQSLESMTADVVPIAQAEREERIAKAQRLLAENKMDALILDCGTSLNYFTGIRWWPSERTMVAIIPARGEIQYVCPGFEEARLREQITIGKDVYVWQEDESPYQLIAKAIKDAGITFGNTAIEERTRFFIVDGVRKEAPSQNYVSGDPVTIGCRIHKSTAEIQLMQKASDITWAAIKQGVSQLK